MPKVSIITPIYCDTSAKVDWLDEMIASVLRQTLADWELILIDDKSPVLLDAVRGKYGDERLRWFENADNFGTAKTRNTAVALAESDCILPLDSDDMLGGIEALEIMYDTWLMDKSRIVYGNVQLLSPVTPTTFQPGKVIQLAPYTFENAMDLRGTLPVTCMHSIACHQNAIAEVTPGQFASGWKSLLQFGREDVEYWIAAGKRGYCGFKIDYTTLIYRKHNQSRDYKLKTGNQLDSMQAIIKRLHNDIYSGRFPVACCGKGKANAPSPTPDPSAMSQQAQAAQVRYITALEGYPEEDLVWVSYQGPKKGSFGNVLTRDGRQYPGEYRVLGTGHYFQVHKRHKHLFEQRQHLKFRVNEPDPRNLEEPEPTVIPQPEPAVQVESGQAVPELSTIVRMDQRAMASKEADVQRIQEPELPKFASEVIIEPNPPQSYSDVMVTPGDLSELGISDNLVQALADERFTIETLAYTTPQRLMSIPGIGIKRAAAIIQKAQELIKGS